MGQNVKNFKIFFTPKSPKLGYNNEVFTYSCLTTTKTKLLRIKEKIRRAYEDFN